MNKKYNVLETKVMDSFVVGALGFEPRSTGLFRFIVPVTHHLSGDP